MIENDNIYSVNLIVENQTYNTISDQVICPICNELKLDTKITACSGNCQYSVCGKCAQQINNCPICRTPPKWKECLVIKQLLPRLDFKCQICRGIVHFNDLQTHYSTHGQNNNNVPILLNDEPIHDVVPIRQDDENNNSILVNFCNFIKSDNFSKLNFFYYIIFY